MFAQPFVQAQIKEEKSKLRIIHLCDGNSPVTVEFPAINSQATGLDAFASKVKCPAWFVLQWHNILADLLCFTVKPFGMWNRLGTPGRLPNSRCFPLPPDYSLVARATKISNAQKQPQDEKHFTLYSYIYIPSTICLKFSWVQQASLLTMWSQSQMIQTDANIKSSTCKYWWLRWVKRTIKHWLNHNFCSLMTKISIKYDRYDTVCIHP